MPEGDTIRRLADTITKKHAGRTVISSCFRHPRLAMVDLTGTSLLHADARGKHLLLRFSNRYTLRVHLRMSGAVYHRFAPDIPSRKRVFEIQLQSGWMTGVDLPVMDLMRTRDEGRAVGFLGSDVCGVYDHDAAVQALRNAADKPVAQAMLDQRIVAGLGNIYAVETPFIVGINPHMRVERIVDLSALLAIGVGLIRTNARLGPQNTTGRNLRRTEHWVLGARIYQCKVCGTKLHRQAGSETPWRRRTAWCVRCQPDDAVAVNLERATKLLALHPCRHLVDLSTGKLKLDVTQPVKTESRLHSLRPR